MGKSDEKQTKKRAHKATDSGESKHKHEPSFDTPLGSSPFAMTFKDTDREGVRHSQWRDQFRQLCEYKVQFGHCAVPQLYSANPKLGKWVSRQRARYREYREEKPTLMTAEYIRALDGIGFDWGTDWASIWSERFRELCEFKAQFGHCLVPIKYSVNPKLGNWITTQRSNYKSHQEGKSSCLTEERIRALDSVGFEGVSSAAIWNKRFEQLGEFKAQFGHCMVSQQYATCPQLANWIRKQRYHHKLHQEGKPNNLTDERIRALESVQFKRETLNAAIWIKRFEQLCEFKGQFGHCLVPLRYQANPKLGRWAVNQRRNYRLYQEGKPSPMTAERIRELESVDFKSKSNAVSSSLSKQAIV
jgi:hypothetical protein